MRPSRVRTPAAANGTAGPSICGVRAPRYCYQERETTPRRPQAGACSPRYFPPHGAPPDPAPLAVREDRPVLGAVVVGSDVHVAGTAPINADGSTPPEDEYGRRSCASRSSARRSARRPSVEGVVRSAVPHRSRAFDGFGACARRGVRGHPAGEHHGVRVALRPRLEGRDRRRRGLAVSDGESDARHLPVVDHGQGRGPTGQRLDHAFGRATRTRSASRRSIGFWTGRPSTSGSTSRRCSRRSQGESRSGSIPSSCSP